MNGGDLDNLEFEAGDLQETGAAASVDRERTCARRVLALGV